MAEITQPQSNSEITSPVEILGTAADDNILTYDLALAPAGESSFTTIASGTSSVTSGLLGTFDPTLLLNGFYTLRLTVRDRGGNVATASAVYQAAGDMKVGHFRLTFKDLEVPMAGLPITVRRTYDSRDKGRGDFGVGWQQGFDTLRLSANRQQGSAWRQEVSGVIIPVFQLVPADRHTVSVTLPNGRVESFELTPSPSSQSFFPLTFVTAFYSPRPGTLGSLTPLGNRSLLVQGIGSGTGVRLVDDQTLGAYDPRTFVYTEPSDRRRLARDHQLHL